VEVKVDGFELFVEAADDVENEGVVRDGFAKVTEILHLTFVVPSIISDEEVALTEGAEVGIGVQGTHCLIPEKSGLDGETNVLGGGTVLGDGVNEVIEDDTEEPSPHDIVHPDPVGKGGNGDVQQDMELQEYHPRVRRKDSRHRAYKVEVPSSRSGMMSRQMFWTEVICAWRLRSAVASY
jgi:hypothetical protein